MTVVLTAMNRFINEADGSQTAFLDGNQPDRLCAPMKAHIEARGGEVRTGTPLSSFLVDESSGAVTGLECAADQTPDSPRYCHTAAVAHAFDRPSPWTG